MKKKQQYNSIAIIGTHIRGKLQRGRGDRFRNNQIHGKKNKNRSTQQLEKICGLDEPKREKRIAKREESKEKGENSRKSIIHRR